MSAASESRLWGRRVESEVQWRELAQYLAGRLSEIVELDVVVEPLTQAERSGFSCRISAQGALGGPLQIEWSGFLKLEQRDGKPLFTASLVLFSRCRRLQIAGQAGSSLELVFERTSDDHGRWIILGWTEDVRGEYEGIEL
jgi:hypothetical protein